MGRILDIIVPVYGKDPEYIYSSLLEIKNGLPKECGIIVIYKNSTVFNYDLLKKLRDNNVIVKKGEFEFQKTDKLLEALKLSDAKFILPMDSHHTIIVEKMEEFINEIRDLDDFMITMTPIDKNVDDNSEKIIRGNWLSAGRYILLTSKLKEIASQIKYRTTYSDDLTFPLFMSKEISNENEIKHININIYVKRMGRILSNTTFVKSVDINFQVVTSLKNILTFTSDFFGTSRHFDSQFLSSFWYYVLRGVMIEQDVDGIKDSIDPQYVLGCWNDIFYTDIDFEEWKEIISNKIIFSNRYDWELKILNELKSK